MVKRQLRVGEIVDDYCPRERRISDHAIVAMVDEDIRLVRCIACDTEHEYRAAKVPPTRKKKPAAGPPPLPPAGMTVTPEAPPAGAVPPAVAESQDDAIRQVDVPVAADAAVAAGVVPTDGPVHRRLIRATLPRIEGQVPERRIPEFTMHNTGGRAPGGHGKSFRAGHGGPHRPGGGGKPGSGHSRPGGGRQGGFSPQGGRQGQGQHRNPFGGRPGRGKKS